MSEDKKSAQTDRVDEDKAADPMSEREIDLNLAATFPASDPPSWTLGTDHQDKPDSNSEDED